MDKNPKTARPDDAALLAIAEQILMRRKLLKKGKWLCDELNIALRELNQLMQAAELRFEECPGSKPTIIIRPSGAQGATGKSVEAYSLRMMARSLRNPGNMVLSRTLNPSCTEARKALIDALFRLYELVTNAKELALARRRARVEAPTAEANEYAAPGTGHRGPSGLSATEPAPSAAERRERLRQQVMKLGKVRDWSERRPETFNRMLEKVFVEVESGELPAAAVSGKMLDLVYADSIDTPVAQAPVPPAPRSPPAAPAASPQEQTGDPETIPERLGDWAAQGLAGNQLFKQIKSQGKLDRRIVQWRKGGQAGSKEIEEAFVSYFLERIARFTVAGHELSFELPESIGPLDVSGLEVLIEQGKQSGAFGIDQRIWGVVGTAFLFLKNAYGLELRG